MRLDIQKLRKDMEEYSKKITSSVAASREFLVKTGIFNAEGLLQEPYKNLNKGE
jgi:hypothetical protein